MYCPLCGTDNANTARFCSSCGRDLLKTTPIEAVRDSQPDITETAVVRGALEGEYEILEELGRGGMAIVFRARDRELEREVAVKVLPLSLAFDKEFVERFQREARTAARLEHPNIIPIYRVGKTGRVTFFVMKLLKGGSLSTRLATSGPLPPSEVRAVLVSTLHALADADRHGIVHRDIKPDNIMFDEFGHVVLTDFGIAKAASGSRLTGTGMSIGTPHYMSPEQARAQQLDGRSDLYSLGIVGYQMLTGEVPFDAEDAFSIGYKHISEPLPHPALPTAEHERLFAVIEKMTAKRPEDRYQSARELLDVLGGAGAGPITVHTKAGPPRAAAPASADVPTTPMPARARPAPAKRQGRRVAAVLAFVALTVVGTAVGGGWWLYDNGLLFPSVDSASTAALELADSVAMGDSAQIAMSDSSTPSDSLGDIALAPADSALPDSTVDEPAASPSSLEPPVPAIGVLALEGVPEGARVFVDGQPVRGTRFRLEPGNHALRVVADGFAEFAGTVPVADGTTHTFRLPPFAQAELPCSEFVPMAYNKENRCFDARANPRAAPVAPVPVTVSGTPSPAVVAAYVSAEGTTIDVRIVQPSSDSVFTEAAVAFVRELIWNPAQKNSRPVAAWTQIPVQPASR